MAKPAITKRQVKGQALSYDELDTNFQNLADATISLTAGTAGTQVVSDLNGNITLVAGTGVTLTGNNTTKTITIDAANATNSFVNIVPDVNDTVVADSANDTLRLTGVGVTVSGNASADSVTIQINESQTLIQSITNSTSGANINFPQGSIYSKNYYLSSAQAIANSAAATVNLSPAGGINGTAVTLQTAVSSLSVTLASDPSIMRQQMILFTTDTGGGSFDIATSQSALWVDGAKTCTRDGTTYIMQIHCYDADNVAPHGNNYFIELLPYA